MLSATAAATRRGCAGKEGGTTPGCTEELFNSAQSWFNTQPTAGLTQLTAQSWCNSQPTWLTCHFHHE